MNSSSAGEAGGGAQARVVLGLARVDVGGEVVGGKMTIICMVGVCRVMGWLIVNAWTSCLGCRQNSVRGNAELLVVANPSIAIETLLFLQLLSASNVSIFRRDRSLFQVGKLQRLVSEVASCRIWQDPSASYCSVNESWATIDADTFCSEDANRA